MRKLLSAALLAAPIVLYLAPAADAAKKPKPNLKVTAAAASPTTVQAGGAVTVKNTVTNKGPGGSPASQVRLYVSEDAAFSATDTQVGKRTGPALKAGKRSAASTSITMPPAVTQGSRFILVCADAGRKVSETNEKDNCRATAAVSISPATPATQGVALTRSDDAVRQQLQAAGNLLYERAQFGASGSTAEYNRVWIMADGAFRLNVLDWNSVSGEICRSTLVGAWTFAEGYTFTEKGGGIVLVLTITPNGGAPGRELFVFGNSEPNNMYLGSQGYLFERNNNMMQNC